MSGVNKVILVGRLGKDPYVRHLESSVSVANFSVATSEVYKDKNTGERREITEWHNVVLWRGLAGVAEKYLHKGDMVYIEGKLRTRSWEKEGTTHYATEVVGDNMTMLSTRSSMTDATPPPSVEPPTGGAVAKDTPATPAVEDDLPF